MFGRFIAYNGVVRTSHTNEKNYYRPVAYVNSKAKITSGNGTSSSPYKLAI